MADKPAAGKPESQPPQTPAPPASPTPGPPASPPPSSIRLDLLMVAGFAMVAGGFALAAAQRGDPAFAWTGAALLVLGGLGDRIQKIVAGKDSFEVDLASRVETVNSMVKATPPASTTGATAPSATAPASTHPATSSGSKASGGRKAAGSVKGLLLQQNEGLAALLDESAAQSPDPASVALAVTAAVTAKTPTEYGQRMAELSKLLSGQ